MLGFQWLDSEQNFFFFWYMLELKFQCYEWKKIIRYSEENVLFHFGLAFEFKSSFCFQFLNQNTYFEDGT